MNNESITKYPKNFLVSNFEKMREKLLDTSGSSRLLNLKQDSRSFIQVTDKQPNELAKLILEEKVLYFVPVPDPTPEELVKLGYQEWNEEQQKFAWLKDKPSAKDWAGVLGIENNFDLPLSLDKENEALIDTNLRTMLFEAEMNKRIKDLASAAKLAIEETGNNILFLCIGFLEWTDQAENAQTRFAPLYMLPVTINKDYKNGIMVHSIRYNGEDIIQNLVLREKLDSDFGLLLPDLTNCEKEDQLLTPEDYFSQVDALLKRKQNDVIRNWKVRRFATLTTLSLGKLLMYRDLDPQKWPAGENNLLEHEVIKRFFHSDIESVTSTFDSESYVLDDVEALHENYPMIENADSSQMSVLIDVLQGKNLVVEGPPGTGKSQTITNIISAALSRGKSVLFIAEKRAALEVVKRRMDKAGLGDFCLDLHSDGIKKTEVLDGFKQRINNQASFNYSKSQYENERQRYEKAREKLLSYAQLINSEWKNTGLTIHEILMAATRYQAEVAPLKYKEIVPENITGDTFSRVMLEEKLDHLTFFYRYLNRVSEQLLKVKDWTSHPWFGLENKGLANQEVDEIIDSLRCWTSHLFEFVKNAMQLCKRYDIQLSLQDDLQKAQSLVKAWGMIPPLKENVDLCALSKITELEIGELAKYVENQKQIASFYQSAKETFANTLIENITLIAQMDDATQALQNLGIDEETSFAEILNAQAKIIELIDIAENVQVFREKVIQHVPSDVLALLRCDFTGFKALENFITLAAALPKHCVPLRESLFDNEELFRFMPDFIDEYEEIKKERNELEQFFKTEKLPSAQVMHNYAITLENTGLFSWLNAEWKQTKKAVSEFTHAPKFNAKHIAQLLKMAAQWSSRQTAFAQDTKNNQLLSNHFAGLRTDIDTVSALVYWYKRVRAAYGMGFGKQVAFAKALFSLPTESIHAIQNLYSQEVTNGLNAFRTLSQSIAKIFTKVDCFSKSDIDLFADPKPFSQAFEQICTPLKACQAYLVDTELSLASLLSQIEEGKRIKKIREEVEKSQIIDDVFSTKLSLTPLTTGEKSKDLQIVIDTLNYSKMLFERCDKTIIDLVKRQTSTENILDLQRVGLELSQQFTAIFDQENAFFAAIGSSRDRWFQCKGTSLALILERNNIAINNEAWLDGWIKYLFAKEKMQQGGFSILCDYLIQNSHSLEFAQSAMKFATYHTLAREIYQQQPTLSQLSGQEQTALRQQFSEYDEKLREIQRKRVAAITAKRKIPSGKRGAKVTSYTDAALLVHEIGKKTRHISIRHLVERAGAAMIASKPCFMMSPMAVAKYIPPGSLKFDIVVMDEASQVKPEDALSCFARGRQIVVVGDPKQLPPTTFFEKSLLNDANDDDAGVIDEAESILDAVSSHFDKRQLQWHYRSRHQSLIEFSNHTFYDGNLVVFPSPWNNSEEFGIKFFHIEQGQFSDSINKTEANAVVTAIKAHLINNKNNESLGVVAMNAKQRELIENMLDSAISKDAVLRDAYLKDSASQDPLFIKNLENAQGDERDVIYISFTYGPKEEGAKKIPQRFGPINGQSGWRRLNVLFTRAKKRIHAYSSMTAEQIVLTPTSSRGVKSLKAYLEFAKTGRLIDQAPSLENKPNSDFEIAVINALSKHGFECVPQVGVAGFFIDIAVRDPNTQGRYLMGIECDGATYHSSKSTRDRDKTRQVVLEGLGWTIRRIWSTDWFNHPEAELKPILDELTARATRTDSINVEPCSV